jgi:acetoin utilization deacetylase AcuC-like enzyme
LTRPDIGRDLSHGFCLINDVAIGLAKLRHEGLARRALIVDLDLHQGDGNATLFQDDPDVFTVSVHEEDIFPVPKMKSDLDIGLPALTGDADYLAAVDDALVHAEKHFDAEVVVYVAGSDPYVNDPLGNLEVSREGMLARDRRVASFAVRCGCPLVALPAGGYSLDSPSIGAAGFREIARLEPRAGNEPGRPSGSA